ncbi:hypothetical protein [Mycobacterium sp.]|uniref:hypothetical protein n=1 Tax=Mycobacterium sp. TaxID=1785 RepID=UPI00345BD4B5
MVHIDVAQRAAVLHLGSALSESDRRYLTCSATRQVWFSNAAGRRSAPAARSRTATPAARFPAVVPPQVCTPTTICAYWEDGGPTEPAKIRFVCRIDGS